MLVLSGFAFSFSTRKFMRAIPPSTAGIAECMRQFCRRTNARQILLATSLVLVAVASLLMQEPLLHAQVAVPRAARPRRLNAKPLATGIDGSQTGLASFTGNFTSITTPSEALALGRQPNCSLGLATGSGTISSSGITYTQTDITRHYELVLHNEAQLTTTPDVFASGCAKQPPAGFGSMPGVFVGTTTTGLQVFAGLGLIYPSFTEGIYLLTGTTNFNLTSFQFSTAGNLTAADLNKDGNGDLVVVDNSLASSAHVTVFLGNADGTIQNGVQYAIAGNYSVAAVIDDVDHDGNLDIVAVSGDQQISVLLGNGDGTFKAAQSFAAPALPGYTSAASTPILNLITADLRGIGKKDVICSNGLVLLGNGDGTFTAAAQPAFPYELDNLSQFGPGLASGDLNNDGKIDLALNDGETVSTWIGKGDGTFTQGQSYATVGTDGFTSIQDLDGDGNADIFVGLGDGGFYGGDEGSANLAYALMGNGNGTFVGAPVLSSGNYTGNNLGDVNGDGIPDIISTPDPGETGFTVALGNGKGVFNPVSTISIPASITITPSGYTSPVVVNLAGAGVSNYAVGDVNGDGKADLVFDINFGDYSAYFVALSNGDGTFAAPVAYAFPQVAPAGDFDGVFSVTGLQIATLKSGGHASLIVAYNEIEGGAGTIPDPYHQGLMVVPGNGDGTFQTTPVLTSSYSGAAPPTDIDPPAVINIADLNGDGNTDLLAVSWTYSPLNGPTTLLQAYLGNGDGTFKAPATVPTAASISLPSYDYANSPCVVADLRNNSKLDIACVGAVSAVNGSQAELAISLGNGDGTFAAPTLLNLSGGVVNPSGGVSGNIAAADFNGDGKVDLALFFYPYSGIYYGNGDGTFTSVNAGTASSPELVPQDLINIGTNANAVVAVQLTTDGRYDILAGNTSLLNIYGSAPNLNPPASSATALGASSTTVSQGTNVTLTATVTGPSGNTTIPTGTVTFMLGSTNLGTESLNTPGVAQLMTTTLPVGTDSITAVYSGDTNFSGSTSMAAVVMVSSAPTPTFALSNGGSISVAAGATTGNTSSITVTPANSFTGAVNLTCAVTTTPASAVSPATCAVSSVVNVTGATAVASTVSVTTTSTTTPGAYAVTVTGVSGAITQTTIVGVTVTASAPPPTFALSNGGSISVAAGATTGNTSSITVTPANSFTGAVNLTCAVTTTPASAVSPATCAVSSVVNVTGATAVASTVSVTTTSTTTPGAYAVTVTGVSGAITQTTIVGLTVTAFVPPPTFALTNSGTVTISSPGVATGNTATITVTPSGGFTGPVALTAAIATSPSGATDLPTLSFNGTTPVTVNGAATATATLTVSTTAPVTGALVRPRFWTAAGGATLACLLLVGIPIRRRRWLNLIGMIVLLVFLAAGVMSCGGGKSSNSGGNGGGTSIPGTTTGNYTITVTGTAGAETQTTTVNLTVN